MNWIVVDCLAKAEAFFPFLWQTFAQSSAILSRGSVFLQSSAHLQLPPLLATTYSSSHRRHLHSNKVKFDSNVNAAKEAQSKDDQLSLDVKRLNLTNKGATTGSTAQTFSFDELAAATGNFRSDCFLGEGGFGKVYKGHLQRIDQVVAIKQLDPNGLQGIGEFVVEVLTLSLADHPNLVKLIGFCAEGDKRLLVYEYMPLGSLENHLHGL